MSKPELLLSNQLCFLVYRLEKEILAKYRPLLDELGITYSQYLALLALWEHEELGIGELCSLLGLDTGTVSPLVKRLEAQGLAEKKRRDDDERAVCVRLTKKGRALEARAACVPGKLASCLLTSETEYRELKATLTGLIERLEKQS